MFNQIRRKLLMLLSTRDATSITVGSYINTQGEHAVTITLMDSWVEAKAALSPAGAKRIAASLNVWADAALQNNSHSEWKAVIRYAIKKGPGEVEAVETSAPAAQS